MHNPTLEILDHTSIDCLLVVRPYGFFRDISQKIARFKKASPYSFVIDDRCCGIPVTSAFELEWQGADLVIFSTGPEKVIDLGIGGFGFSHMDLDLPRRRETYRPEQLTRLENWYKDALNRDDKLALSFEDLIYRVQHYTRWLDSRLPEVNLYNFLMKVEKRKEEVLPRKAWINELYSEELPWEAQFSRDFQWWRFNISLKAKNQMLEEVFRTGLFASGHYYPFPYLVGFNGFPEAWRAYCHTVNLFNNRHASPEFVEKVIQIAKRFFSLI